MGVVKHVWACVPPQAGGPAAAAATANAVYVHPPGDGRTSPNKATRMARRRWPPARDSWLRVRVRANGPGAESGLAVVISETPAGLPTRETCTTQTRCSTGGGLLRQGRPDCGAPRRTVITAVIIAILRIIALYIWLRGRRRSTPGKRLSPTPVACSAVQQQEPGALPRSRASASPPSFSAVLFAAHSLACTHTLSFSFA